MSTILPLACNVCCSLMSCIEHAITRKQKQQITSPIPRNSTANVLPPQAEVLSVQPCSSADLARHFFTRHIFLRPTPLSCGEISVISGFCQRRPPTNNEPHLCGVPDTYSESLLDSCFATSLCCYILSRVSQSSCFSDQIKDQVKDPIIGGEIAIRYGKHQKYSESMPMLRSLSHTSNTALLATNRVSQLTGA